MRYLQRAWHYVFIEPYTWLFYSFFQPYSFKREYESKGLLHRMVAMFRLALPMFLFSYPLALLVYALGSIIASDRASFVWLKSLSLDTVSISALEQFLLAVALATLLGILWSVLWGIASGIAGGIAWSLTLGIAGAYIVASDLKLRVVGGHIVVSAIELQVAGGSVTPPSITAALIGGITNGIFICIVFAIIGGIIGSIAWSITEKRGSQRAVRIGGLAGGIAGGIIGYFVAAIVFREVNKTDAVGSILKFQASLAYIAPAIAGSIAEVIARPIAEKRDIAVIRVAILIGGIVGVLVGSIEALGIILSLHISATSLGVWVVAIIGNSGLSIIGSILGYTILDIVGLHSKSKNIVAGLMMLIAGTLFFGIGSISLSSILGITLAITMGTLLGIIRPSTVSIILAITLASGRFETLFSITHDIPEAFKESFVLILCFVMGRFRLPLYPISAFSAFRASLSSRTNPREVFTYLHRSSLYWDECVYPPLPGLGSTLLIAAEQDFERTLAEIGFILAERPQQLHAARAASLEIVIHDLERCTNLREVANAAQRINRILPPDAGLIDPRWVTPFARLSDVSRDAARASSPLGWLARRSALQEMITNLNKVYPNTAFTDARLNVRLGEIVKTWREVAQYELKESEKAPEKTSRIGNPYNPGPALELRDSLFVGRRDLAQQLSDALGRGRQHPTFLLHGERRMGKSSTLKQLPDLLGSRYLPIFYDLQMRGFSSSIAAFLGKIADEIYKVMRDSGLATKKLAYEQLQVAQRKNEAEVYYHFELWLAGVEQILEREDRTLLLTFDEFEKLEEAGRDRYFDLRLLLDWFRSIIQNHPRLALLFSGVRTFSEMGENWAGYFVNVQTLEISFLRSADAHKLITRPIPNFPGEQIFAKSVVESIMRVTNCHPFLVQAICSALLDSLNANERERIEPHQVGEAANQVLKNWENYFRDQWHRTDEDQRACILTLNRVGTGNLREIAQQSSLAHASVHRALETLLGRDIVVYEQGIYRIAVPLFGVWVQRGNHH